MTKFKDFLESSTIHGLGYISTSSNKLVKIFWVFVVLGGVSTAVYYIHNAFQSWNESPIATSIETFPIMKASFPRVTVCPPAGSNTAFNIDLVNAGKDTLDKNTRKELVELAEEWMQDKEFKEIFQMEGAFKEKGKYRNWYESFTNVFLPKARSPNKIHQARFIISATSGSMSTPWFGTKFSSDNFQFKLEYKYEFYPSYKITESYPNASFVLKLLIDTKETDGDSEVLELKAPRRSIEKFQHSGKIEEIRKYEVDSLRGYNSPIKIKFYRASGVEIVEEWSKKRMTGFSVDWYYESEIGNVLEIAPDQKYHQASQFYGDLNRSFVKFMNILHYAVFTKGYSENEVFEVIKETKLELVKRVNDFGTISDNFFRKTIAELDLMELLVTVEDKLQLNHSLPVSEIYKSVLTNSLLESGHEMYLYLANCPQRGTPIKRKRYEDFFFNASSRAITEVVLNVMKNDEKEKLKWRNFENNAAMKIFEKLDNSLHLDEKKMEFIFSSGEYFNGSSPSFNDCNNEDNCKSINDFLGKDHK